MKGPEKADQGAWRITEKKGDLLALFNPEPSDASSWSFCELYAALTSSKEWVCIYLGDRMESLSSLCSSGIRGKETHFVLDSTTRITSEHFTLVAPRAGALFRAGHFALEMETFPCH